MNSKILIFLFAVYCACALVFGASTTDDDFDYEPTEALRASCVLPMLTGICRARMPRWGYDSERKECVPFFYGGCMGNGNNFEAESDCLNVCRGV